MTERRQYAGVDGAERLARRRGQLLEAGLQLLGGDTDAAEMTVRGVCQTAGLATRYFYESFADKEQFIEAVFDWVIARLGATTQAAVAAAPATEQNRAGLANIVGVIEADPRIGRLMFGAGVGHPAVIRKRGDSDAFFAMLSGRHVETVLQRSADDQIKAFAHFVVGGVSQTLSAWLAGEIALDATELTDQLTAIVDTFRQAELLTG
jgi:AcrR family transcriptional regulator